MRYFKTDILKKGISKIQEALKNPVDVSWTKIPNTNNLIGDFKVSKDYRIESDEILHGFRTFKFRALYNGVYTTNIINDGSNDIFRVYPTIKTEAEWILDEIDPTGLIFTAVDKSFVRKDLYEKFCIEYTTTHKGWFYDISLEDDKTIYLIFKEHVTPEMLLEVLKWCLINYFNII